MYVILGGTGHVGRAVAQTVLAAGHDVTVVTRQVVGASEQRHDGVDYAAVDVNDTDTLRALFQRARRVFVLNPPAAVSGNTDVEERKTVCSILKALRGVPLEKLVVQSTYGAQPGKHCGDLGVLYELEQGAQALNVPVCIVRAAYYMSNWAGAMSAAKATGVLQTCLPPTQAFPMVAPEDVGGLAGQLLMSDVEQTGIHNIEGPKSYTPSDVVAALSRILGRAVQVQVIPQERWYETYRGNGFSKEAAQSYVNMTGLFVHQHYDRPADPVRGSTSLEACLKRYA
ncbi:MULTISPECIES: NmrA family NAD(P)-binding protein [unclassified Gluconobacter]|uniref:NmrA family NAD(P)-binding protein n=1 Tax=unclassified Gluconobacter TaxID=2644261 RepID=UPI001C046374|nr:MULTISPECIES: NmrA family NAD(P)-binding protein [unclassified Gluconobacter]